MFSCFLHIFSSVPQKRIKKVFYKIKHSELVFFIYVCVKKQMNYTTYLFDFDYTLADSSRGIVTCFRNVLNRQGDGSGGGVEIVDKTAILALF